MKQWLTDDESEMIEVIDLSTDFPFFFSGYLKLHYAISVSNIFLVIAVERSFACYFLNDYEKKSRFWIAVAIVLVDQMFNLVVAYLFFLFYFSFFYMILITAAPNLVAITVSRRRQAGGRLSNLWII